MPTLFLIPNFLADDSKSDLSVPLPVFELQKINSLKYFVAESEKACRAFIKYSKHLVHQNDLIINTLNEHTHPSELKKLIQPLNNGYDMGLISDAGLPCVADPGSDLVLLAHKLNFKIDPLVGPSSIMLALMASGLNGQNFSFHGYIPIKPEPRKSFLKSLEPNILNHKYSQLFIETPYRNIPFFNEILNTFNPKIYLSISANIHGINPYYKTQSIGDWKRVEIPQIIHKVPAIFILGLPQNL